MSVASERRRGIAHTPSAGYQDHSYFTMSMMTEDRKAGEILDEAPAPEIEFPHGDDLTTDEKFACIYK